MRLTLYFTSRTLSSDITQQLHSFTTLRYRKSRNKNNTGRAEIGRGIFALSLKSRNNKHEYETVRIIQTAFTYSSIAL
jgi:hypothetical protein